MDFYEAVYRRRTVREWSKKTVPEEAVRRILNAGLAAPSNNHMRGWEFIVLHENAEKEKALQFVKQWAAAQAENRDMKTAVTSEQKMYAYAIPRQYSMLAEAPYVIIPLFKAGNNLNP